MNRGGRRGNPDVVPVCEICGRTTWVSRIRGHVICGRCEPKWREAQRRAAQARADLRDFERRERGGESDEPLENPPEWDELCDVQGAIFDGLQIKDLWESAGQGDMDYALGLLSDYWDVDDATEVKVVAEPDDILGELIRVWIR